MPPQPTPIKLRRQVTPGRMSSVFPYARSTAYPWLPTSITAAALVAWYDPSDLTTLWQDSARTTPVTAAGDPVGCMDDKSGNRNHALQATSTKRPLWQADGSLLLDGSDDQFQTATAVGLTDSNGFHSTGAAIKLTATPTGGAVGCVIDSDDAVSNRVSQFLRVADNSGTPIAQTIAFNTTIGGPFVDNIGGITTTGLVLTERTSLSSTEVYLNGVGDGGTTVTPTGQLQTQTGKIMVGGFTGGGANLNGKFYGAALYQGALSDTDHAALVAFLTAKLPAVTATTITVSPATITLTGQAVKTNQAIVVSNATITMTPKAVVAAQHLIVLAGAIHFTGQTITVNAKTDLAITAAQILFVPKTVVINAKKDLTFSNGTITFTGQTINMLNSKVIPITAAQIVLSPQSLTINATKDLVASTAAITFTGQTVRFPLHVLVTTGGISFVAQNVDVTNPSVPVVWNTSDTSNRAKRKKRSAK